MIVCVCNRLSDSKVREAVQAGAKRPADVFRILGVPRSCGSCTDAIETIIEQEEAKAADGEAAKAL